MNPIFLIIILNLIQNSIAFEIKQYYFVRQYMSFNSSHPKTSQSSMDSKIRCSSLCQQTSDPKCVGYCYEEADGQCNFYHEAVAAQVVVGTVLYEIQSAVTQFTEARNYCVNNGGFKLAIPKDEIENQQLASFLTTNAINSIWLGIIQDDTASGEWHINEKNEIIIGYSNWLAPPSPTGANRCAQLSADGTWSEVSCQDSTLPFVCTDPSGTAPTSAPAPAPEEPEVPVEQGQTCYKLFD